MPLSSPYQEERQGATGSHRRSIWEALRSLPNGIGFRSVVLLLEQPQNVPPARRQAWKVRLVKGLYERGLSAEDVRQLFRFIDWIMELPEPLERLFLQEITRYQEEKRMPFIDIAERVGMEKGLLEGIEVSLEVKFGEGGLKLLAEIRGIQDHEVLRAVLQAIKTAASPEELRRVWARGRRPKKGRGDDRTHHPVPAPLVPGP